MISEVLVFIVVSLFLIKMLARDKWQGRPPPHPPLVPLLGNMLVVKKLDSIMHYALHSLTESLGHVFRLRLGGRWTLIVTGFHQIKEINSLESTANRSYGRNALLYISNLIWYGKRSGPCYASGYIGNIWSEAKELRRFTLRTLKDLGGMGSKRSEEIVIEEITKLKEAIDKMINNTEDGVVDLDKLFNKASLNVVWNFTTSERFDYDEEKMEKFYRYLELLVVLGTKIMGKPLGVYPWLRYVPPFRSHFNQAFEGFTELRAFIAETIKKHADVLDREHPRDFIDKYLIDLDSNLVMTEANLLYCCLDLFIAGSETSSKTIMYALAYLINHPDIQRKVRDEVSQIESDMIVWTDKDKLSYTEATLNEVWRMANVVPIAPPRVVTSPIKLDGHDIPPDTHFYTSTYSVHMDQQYWRDP